MDLVMFRTYDDAGGGTNGDLYLRICHTIELPWLENARGRSCIPEGRYELLPRTTAKHKDHLLVWAVPGRDGILIHPANNALKELQGCIAPVTTLTGPGLGLESRAANEKLKAYVAPAFQQGEHVFLTIKEQFV